MRLTLAALAACFAMPVAAQQCGERSAVENILRGQYGERVQGEALSAGNIVTIWANLETGTWSLVATNPAGVSCMLAAGDSYVAVNEPQGVDG